jgi:hypothetical protein
MLEVGSGAEAANVSCVKSCGSAPGYPILGHAYIRLVSVSPGLSHSLPSSGITFSNLLRALKMSTTAKSTSTSTVSIPATAPAGLLTITQPPQSTIAFFKIAPSQPVTFAWNFSYVLSTPASLTVSAICENGNTYPVGPTNGIIPGSATSVVWDPYAWQQSFPNSPLAQATYTLEIFDERGPGSARTAGKLQPNNALRFALYTPQPYTPIGSGQPLLYDF